jgi:hypothetical protein
MTVTHRSIINERRHHSSFQLIIITHDENFLRKLGEADVMEYYWCVGFICWCDHPTEYHSHLQASVS